MATYRTKPKTVDATLYLGEPEDQPEFDRFRSKRAANCATCGDPMSKHVTVEDWIVCPGSWVTTDEDGQVTVYTSTAFKDTFERVD